MGQDKALLPFLGIPLIQRAVLRLKPVADEILVTTNHPETYSFLSVTLVSDIIPGRGALGGLYTALNFASYPLVAVAACDMPFTSPELFAAERDLLLTSDVDIVIPRTDEGLEPFHAVYRRDTCLPPLLKALGTGKWRVDAWFSQVKLHILGDEEIQRYDPQGLCFRNVNTPEELPQAELLARQLEI